MDSTSLSLLERLRQPNEEAAWERFVDLYTPFLFACGRQWGLSSADAEDLVQDVLILLVRHLPKFEHDGCHGFRAWLKTVVRNCWLNRRRSRRGVSLDDVAEPATPDEVGLVVERDYHQAVSRRALQLMQSDFEPTTWQACWQTVVEGRPAADVAARLGLSVGAVYVARSRVLARLRHELKGLLD